MRKHPLAHCERCPFQNAPFVPTQNPHPQSRLAVIGEAPGAYEAGRGIPFTGPSGKLLDQVLKHNGYDRKNVMVTNVCLCRPDNNDDPPKAAIEACAPRLAAEIASSGVTSILAVGGTAASTLIDPKKKISTLRVGPPKPYIVDPNIKVVASWHPAFCLRSPDTFPNLVSDTAKLKGSGNEIYVRPKYRVFSSESDILEGIRRLRGIDQHIIIDIETGFDKDEDDEHSNQHDLLCIGIAYSRARVVIFDGANLSRPNIQYQFAEFLRNARIIAHNGKSDLEGLSPLFGNLKLYGDTMLASYALDERTRQHSLENLSIELLGAPNWKAEFKKGLRNSKDYNSGPREKLYEYNAIDCSNTWLLWELFSSRMQEREWKIHNFMIEASNAIMGLEMSGIRFDEVYSKELQVEFEEDLFGLETEISRVTGRNINPRSPMQIQRWFSDQGIVITSTEADVLEALFVSEKLDPKAKEFIRLLLKHRRGAKLNGTYVKGFQKRFYEGSIYTTYTLHGTTSGRLASRNPNLQNIVRDSRIKHQFTVSHEDNYLIQLDYKQAEGRVITTLAEDEYLASLFRDPTKDIFNDMCEQIYGKDNYGKEARVKIKSVFYGLAYGRGAKSIGTELDIPIREAEKLLYEFKALIPKTVAWQASIVREVLSGNDLVTPFGRKRSFWLITEQNKTDVINEALSYMPQSIASDICLRALIETQKKLDGKGIMRMTIHDALVLEAHKDNVEEVIQIVTNEMKDSALKFTDYVPFEVDSTIGKRWSEL